MWALRFAMWNPYVNTTHLRFGDGLRIFSSILQNSCKPFQSEPYAPGCFTWPAPPPPSNAVTYRSARSYCADLTLNTMSHSAIAKTGTGTATLQRIPLRPKARRTAGNRGSFHGAFRRSFRASFRRLKVFDRVVLPVLQ